jgi:phage terminase large subunit-like protein
MRAVDATVPIRTVTASRGKAVRAEPIAALYEQGRVAHVGDRLGALEDEMLSFSTTGYQGAGSPNRADALVWALTWLMQASQPFAAPLVLTRKREGLI